MSDEKNSGQVKALNSVLKGEHMAIDIYETFISKIDDRLVAEQLQMFQKDHQRHADILSARICELGGEPEESRGFAGAMAESMSKIKTWGYADKADMLRQLYDGEDKGIAASLSNVDGVLDEQSRRVIDEILSDDHDHLKQLQSMLSHYETNQSDQFRSF